MPPGRSMGFNFKQLFFKTPITRRAYLKKKLYMILRWKTIYQSMQYQ
jgi:hypothetical protein